MNSTDAMEMDAEPGADHSHHAGHGEGGHSMAMSFHFGVQETVLFDGWKIVDVGGMIGSCVAVFVLGLLFEVLKSFRGYLLRKEGSRTRQLDPVISCRQDAGEGKVRVATPRNKFLNSIANRAHFLQTLLHILQFVLGYSLMLIFMTYNVWLCLAVTVGIGFGYLFFGWSHEDAPADINGDCCH